MTKKKKGKEKYRGEVCGLIVFEKEMSQEEMVERGLHMTKVGERAMMAERSPHTVSFDIYQIEKHYDCPDCYATINWDEVNYQNLEDGRVEGVIVEEKHCDEHEPVEIEIE